MRSVRGSDRPKDGRSAEPRFGDFTSGTASRSKKTLHAAEQDRPDVAAARAALKAEQSSLHARRLVFIDETSVTVLVFWLAIIFASFGLFARPNAVVVAALLVCAVSAASAIFLILELGHPFFGLMTISSVPLSNALAPLGP